MQKSGLWPSGLSKPICWRLSLMHLGSRHDIQQAMDDGIIQAFRGIGKKYLAEICEWLEKNPEHDAELVSTPADIRKSCSINCPWCKHQITLSAVPEV
jgi:hypothetical protein